MKSQSQSQSQKLSKNDEKKNIEENIKIFQSLKTNNIKLIDFGKAEILKVANF